MLMMKKSLVFDSGPLISLAINNLLWLLEPLKKSFAGEFYITPAVYEEVVKKPFYTKRYKFEALQVYPLVLKNILRSIEHPAIRKKTEELLGMANKIFKAQGNWIHIVHYGEMEALATALFLNTETIVVDERTTRQLIEDPFLIAKHLERELHMPVDINRENLLKIKEEVKNLQVLRSTELAVCAFELDLLQKYVAPGEKEVIPNISIEILDGILWGLKLNGCSLKEEEIEEIINMERQRLKIK